MSMTMVVDYFQSSLLPHLRSILSQSLEGQEYALFQALEDSKTRIVAFGNLKPKNARERQDIESGTLSGPGGIKLFGAPFKQAVLQLSDSLNASEIYCASLIEHALSDSTQPPTPATIQDAKLVRLNEQAALLQCLRLIIEAAARSDAPTQHTKVTEFLQRWVYDIVKGPYSLSGGTRGSLVSKLVLEIDALHEAIVKQQNTVSAASDDLSISWARTILLALRQQRSQLGHILYLISATGQISPAELTSLVQWLQKQPDMSEGLSAYILTTVFAATSPPTPDEDDSEDVPAVFTDARIFVDMSSSLNGAWANADLKAAMLLQYSLFHLEIRSRDEHVRGEVSVIEDEVGASLKKAISAGAFQALSKIIIKSRDPRHTSERSEFTLDADDSVIPARVAQLEVADETTLLPSDFRPYLLQVIDDLVVALIRRLSRTLRDVRKQEEDVSHSSRAGATLRGLSPAPVAPVQSTSTYHSKNSIESLFRLIAIIYDEQPLDSGLRFWSDEDGSRLFPFLRWAAESRQPGTIVGMLDMVSSLAKGSSCAAFAYNFLSTGGGHYAPAAGAGDEGQYVASGTCSWSTLFSALHHYETRLPPHGSAPAAAHHFDPSHGHISSSTSSQLPNARFTLPPEEIAMLNSFLRVLRNVARYSSLARLALYENRDFSVVQTLFNLASFSIPLELKFMLFDALSAFAASGSGAVMIEAVHQMWGVLEKMEIIPVRGPTQSGALSVRGRPAGAVIELDMVEGPGKTYPATLGLLRLLNSLIYTPQKALTLREGFEAESKTIPLNLGMGYRVPGLKPYVDFVVDKVFVKLFEREYAFPDELWQVFEASLCFIEKSLVSFDLGVLTGPEFAQWRSGASSDRNKALTTLAGLASHPGFFVLKDTLCQPNIRNNLLYVVNQGFASTFSRLNFSYARHKAVLRSLRILHRVLQVQGTYGEVLLPLLNDAGELPGIGHAGFPLTSMVPLDAAILQTPSIIPNIAMYMTIGDPEIAFFVIGILRALSDHPNFNWGPAVDPIVTSLRGSASWPVINASLAEWLETDAEEDLDDLGGFLSSAEFEGETRGAAGASTVQRAIIDFLVHTTGPGCVGPNVGHLLLGLPNPRAEIDGKDVQRSCLRAVLGLIGQGVDGDASEKVLKDTHPALAEKCYQLIHQLCAHPLTSGIITRYLRSQEQFFSRQLSMIPVQIPSVTNKSGGRIIYRDGEVVQTSFATVRACLWLQSFLLQSYALELRLLDSSAQHVRAQSLVDGLFSVPSSSRFGDAQEMHIPSQPLTRILQALDSLSVRWEDGVVLPQVTLQLFNGLDWEACLRQDDRGCPIYDFRLLVSILRNARVRLQRAGSLSAPGAEQQLKLETEFVLKSAALENHRRELAFALNNALESWAALLEVTLSGSMAQRQIPSREAALHDLMTALPAHIGSASPSSTTLSATYLLLMSQLRESVLRQALTSTTEHSFTYSIPADRLHVHLKGALECLIAQGTSERTRGNLYTFVLRFLQMLDELEEINSSS